jgi:hypothetical protein
MATSESWIGSTTDKSGRWVTAADWSGKAVPTSTTAVTLELAGSYGVTITGTADANSVTIDNAHEASYLAVNGALNIATSLVITLGVVRLESYGVIKGATISTGAGGSIQYMGGVLSGVTYEGTLAVNGTASLLVIQNGITLEGAGGSGAGTFDITGAGSAVVVQNTTTLSNATINVGNNNEYAVFGFEDTGSGTQTFTLASTLTLHQVGTYFSLAGGSEVTDQMINDGAIHLTETAGGNTEIYGAASFINNGTIVVGTGNSLDITQEAGFINNKTITIDSNADVLIEGGFTNAAGGTINDLSKGGLDVIGGMINDGTIDVAIKLTLVSAVTGTGKIALAAGGNLDMVSDVASTQTLALTGTGSTLELGTGFAGSVSGLAEGDLLLLHGIAASTAAISGDDLVITPTSGSPMDIALSGSVLSSSTPVAAGSITDDGVSLSFVSIGGTKFTLTTGETITGGTDDNLIFATAASLVAADNIDAGTAKSNVMVLQGGGVFDLAAPAALTGVAYFIAEEGQAASGSIAGTRQAITTRAGMTGTITVYPGTDNTANTNPFGVTIYGAADSMTFDLSDAQGSDIVNLGSAKETVDGSAAAGHLTTIHAATAAEAGATITALGGDYAASAHTVLHVAAGGAITLNANDDNMTVDISANASTLTLGSLGFIVANGGAGNDTITAGGAYQMLSGGGGTNVLVGSTAGDDTFSDTSAGLNGDTIKNFIGTDQIIATDMSYSSQLATWTQTTSTEGTLSFTDGTHSVAVTLDGSFNNTFVLGENSAGTGVVVTYL